MKNGLYKRGKSWCVCVKINGVQVRKSFGTNRPAADAWLSDIKKQRVLSRVGQDSNGLRSLLTPQTKLTFAQAADKYLAERSDLKNSTQRGYREVLRNYLLPEFGSTPIADITTDDLASFQASISKKVSAVRVNNIMGFLRYVLKECVNRELIDKNPAQGLRTLKEKPVDVDPLTQDELQRVFAVMNPQYKLFFICQAYTGCRPSELLALRWMDVSTVRSEIYIKRGRVRGQEGTTKTNAGTRVVPMFPPVKEALQQLANRQLQHADGYIFLTRHGQPINKHMDREWRVALRWANVRHRPSYHLRHTFASMCLAQGCDPAWLARMLGHSSVQTTFKHYARYINNAARQNEKLMTEFLAKDAQKGDHLQPTQNVDAQKAHGTGLAKVIEINGGGGENRTRVQGRCEAGIYKFSLRLFQLCLTTPAEKGQDNRRVCAYILV